MINGFAQRRPVGHGTLCVSSHIVFIQHRIRWISFVSIRFHCHSKLFWVSRIATGSRLNLDSWSQTKNQISIFYTFFVWARAADWEWTTVPFMCRARRQFMRTEVCRRCIKTSVPNSEQSSVSVSLQTIYVKCGQRPLRDHRSNSCFSIIIFT